MFSTGSRSFSLRTFPMPGRRFSNFQGKTSRFAVTGGPSIFRSIKRFTSFEKPFPAVQATGITIHLQPSTLNLNEDSGGLVHGLHEWPVDDFSWANPGLSFHSWHSRKLAPLLLTSLLSITIVVARAIRSIAYNRLFHLCRWCPEKKPILNSHRCYAINVNSAHRLMFRSSPCLYWKSRDQELTSSGPITATSEVKLSLRLEF